MQKNLTWKKAIDKVFSESKSPLHCREIAEAILKDGLVKTSGATPVATVGARISSSIKHDGENSPYIKVDKGVYSLRSKSFEGIDNSESDDEEQYDIISSFGMFWKRSEIIWKSKTKLLGMQQIGADAVDFCDQLGIYLLYDGREVIYVGRSLNRPLGRRLFEHTKDRLSTRWDRFSWFGLLPVSDKGKLGKLPESFESKKLISALEAILVEALEPRQNRKRGDDLSAVEYIQKEDELLRKQRLTEEIQSLF